jgi:hypothetical protein
MLRNEMGLSSLGTSQSLQVASWVIQGERDMLSLTTSLTSAEDYLT